MKQTILSGLAAITFGVLSSCSNIIEDSGVNFPSKAQMGELCLSINSDPSVSITTKAIPTTNVDLSEFKDKLNIIGTTANSSSVNLGTSADYKDGASKAVPAGTYKKIAASYDGMDSKTLAFDAPVLLGEHAEDVVVTANSVVDNPVSITAKLKNSIITVDEAAFIALSKVANINKLCVYEGSKNSLPSELYSLLSSDNSLEKNKTLFVKDAANNVFIHIDGSLIAEPSKTFKVTEQVKELSGTATAAAKNYSVKYALSSNQGSLKLTIIVDGAVTVVPIEVPVNPYQ